MDTMGDINGFGNLVSRSSILFIGLTSEPDDLLSVLNVIRYWMLKRLKKWGKKIKKGFSNTDAKSSGSGNIFKLTLPLKATINHVECPNLK